MNDFHQGWLNVSMLAQFEEKASDSAANAATFVNEMIDSVRTVAALCRERETMRLFDVKIKPTAERKRLLILGSAGYGLLQGSILLVLALLYSWSSWRLAEGVVGIRGPSFATSILTSPTRFAASQGDIFDS